MTKPRNISIISALEAGSCSNWICCAKRSTACRLYHCSRSEEHTSELQSPCNIVCRLLLEKKKDVEMWRMVDHPDAGEEPLEIFQQEVSVFEKPEHAQVHADTGNQPCATRGSVFRFCNLPAQPKIHRGSGKKERGKRWIPGAVKNVARGHQQILSRIPEAT